MIPGFRAALAAAALAALAFVASADAALADRRVALVIGNGTYAELGTLANPTNDAQDIAATLRGMGFQVVEKDNVDERTFTALLSNFATAATGADVALFYYSGHGLQYKSENYLVPVDATLENRFSLTHETIPLADVQAAVSGARTALLYVDACRSFPLAGTFLASANERVAPVKGLAPMEDLPNTFIGFSASAGQTASDGGGRNSPFSTAMLDMLPKAGLDVSTMFNAVTKEVVAATGGAQKPQSFSGLSDNVVLVASAAASDGADAGAEERAYRDAAGIGTLGAYRAFIARYPGGFYSELAREAMNKIEATQTPAPPSSTPIFENDADRSKPPIQIAAVVPPEASVTLAAAAPDLRGWWVNTSKSANKCPGVELLVASQDADGFSGSTVGGSDPVAGTISGTTVKAKVDWHFGFANQPQIVTTPIDAIYSADTLTGTGRTTDGNEPCDLVLKRQVLPKSLPKGIAEANLSYFGKPIEKIGDWTVARSDAGCFMFTEATGVFPSKWLTYRPWIYFSATPGSGLVQNSLFTGSQEDAAEVFEKHSVTAFVSQSDGSPHPISSWFMGPELRMVSRCKNDSDGTWCLDDQSVQQLLNADTLTVRGDTTAGQPAAVTYGIRGYAAAAKRINAMCGAKIGFLYGDYSSPAATAKQ